MHASPPSQSQKQSPSCPTDGPTACHSGPKAWSEDAILACLSRHFPLRHPSLLLGRGDDCAVLKAEQPLAVSTDLFLEDTHFRSAYFTPGDIGYKALAINISDLAGCGARPLGFTLCLGLPARINMAWLDAFFEGMALLANRYNIVLAGGDLSRSATTLSIAITVWGEAATPGNFLRRGGSIPGDSIFVTGSPGLARVGLSVLEKHGRAALQDWPTACVAHLRPQSHVDKGLMLARAGFNARPPALMDLSDGIMRDLPRLLGLTGELSATNPKTRSGLGARLTLTPTQLHEEVVRYAAQHGKDPVCEALLGGEEYCLLGSCAPDMLPALHAAIPDLLTLGVVTNERGIFCNGVELDNAATMRGFDHFEATTEEN